MLVNEAKASEDYVIVGGGASRSFTMAQSAHAISILSNAIYSDKILAVVREYLCNAIDAHVRAGQKRPIEVTADSNQFTVRDFGEGIADERIADVFCTYFGSDKTNDDGQIGGFGLGAKAAFAYSDHFTVISRHKGVQTTYAIHKGGPKSGGMPVIDTMSTIPTDEHSGLTVTVPVLDNSDAQRFVVETEKLALCNGAIVKLNGGMLTRFDLGSIEEDGVVAIPHTWNTPRVSVIYGGVRYPLEGAPELEHYFERIKSFANAIDRAFLVYAPPSSISLTPSREALSFDDKTLEFLTKRLRRIIHQILSQEGPIKKQIQRRAVMKFGEGRLAEIQWPKYRLKDKKILGLADIAYDYAASQCNGRDIKQLRRFLREGDKRQWVTNLHRRENRSGYEYDAAFWRRRALRVLKDYLKCPLYVQKYDTTVAQFKRFPGHKIISRTIYVVRRRDEIARIIDQHSHNHDLFLIHKKLGGAKLDALIRRAAQFGFTMKLAPAPEKETAPVVETPVVAEPAAPKPKFRAYPYDEGYFYPSDLKSLMTAATYVYIPKSKSHTRGILHPRKLFKAEYPDMALAVTAAEARALEADGAVRLEKILLDRLDAIEAAPTVHDRRYCRLGDMDRSFCSVKNRRIMHAFYDWSYQDDPVADASFRFWRMMRGYSPIQSGNNAHKELVEPSVILNSRIYEVRMKINKKPLPTPALAAHFASNWFPSNPNDMDIEVMISVLTQMHEMVKAKRKEDANDNTDGS